MISAMRGSMLVNAESFSEALSIFRKEYPSTILIGIVAPKGYSEITDSPLVSIDSVWEFKWYRRSGNNAI